VLCRSASTSATIPSKRVLNSSIVGFNFNLGLDPIFSGASGSIRGKFNIAKKQVKIPLFKAASGTSVMKLLAPSGSLSVFFYDL